MSFTTMSSSSTEPDVRPTSSNTPRSTNPTNTYWISPHGFLTKTIPILDLTNALSEPFPGFFTDTYKAHIKAALKPNSSTPIFTLNRHNFLGTKYTITNAQGDLVAQWKHSIMTSTGDGVLSFPADSEHSSHPVTLTNKRLGSRTEKFVVNSVCFAWEADSLWKANNLTLYKIYGSGERERRIEVGRFAEKWWGGFVSSGGGAFVVDEREIDRLVAVLSLMIVLKKKTEGRGE